MISIQKAREKCQEIIDKFENEAIIAEETEGILGDVVRLHKLQEARICYLEDHEVSIKDRRNTMLLERDIYDVR